MLQLYDFRDPGDIVLYMDNEASTIIRELEDMLHYNNDIKLESCFNYEDVIDTLDEDDIPDDNYFDQEDINTSIYNFIDADILEDIENGNLLYDLIDPIDAGLYNILNILDL